MFPEVYIELQAEIQKHAVLLEKLLQLPVDCGLEMKLGEVAAHCGIVLDGFYSAEDIERLCGTLTNKLKRMRGEIVLSVVPALPH